MSNICEHDYLRRKCPFCEIAQLERENEQLRAELDRLKREIESHGPEGRNYTNQQVVELRLERERLIEENRKLLEERDEARSKAEEAWKEIDSLERLREDRDKLIEGLRMCIFNHGCWHQEDYVAYMRDILKEVGVTVE